MMASSTLFNVIIFAILLALKCGFTFAHGEEESEESEDRSMFLYKLIGDWYELQYENKMMEEKIEMLEGNLEAMGNTNKDLTSRSAYAFNAQWVHDESPSVGDTLIFDRVPLNQNGVYSNTTGEYTVPVDGTYTFSTTLCTHGGDSWVKIKILADTTVMHIFMSGNTEHTTCRSTSTVGQLQKGMKVKIVVNQCKIGSKIFYQSNNDRMCTFSGFLIN